MLCHPCILGDPHRQARGAKSEAVPNKGEQNQKWLPHPCLLKAQKRAEMLRHPCILGDPQRQTRGAKSEVAASPLPSQDPKEGGNAMSPLHSWGSPTPNAGSKIRSGCLALAFSRPKRGRKCYVTPAFSGIPIAKRGEQNQKSSPTKGNKIRSRSLTPAFSEPKREQKCYVTPAFSGIPNAKRGEQNQKWLLHPCLLGGPKEGGNAMSPLHSRASPTPSAGSKIGSRPQQRGTKSEVAASCTEYTIRAPTSSTDAVCNRCR